MTELKLKCFSCDYERIIGEREFIEDLQQCPNCGSENIEIISTEDSTPARGLDRYLPEERKRIVKRRMTIIGVIGIIFLTVGIFLYSISVLYSISGELTLLPLAITLGVIGVIFLIISIGWWTDAACCCSRS
jgi:hypothetical protein